MVATQTSAPPLDLDIELGAPPPYEEVISSPPPYVPNEPVTTLTVNELVMTFQSEPISRVDGVPATTSHEPTRQSPASPTRQNPIRPNRQNPTTRRTVNQNKAQ
uniref:Uncharacterized protein n=1 Tax=Acrobeloides nanus TaxID=290746 RepID=A0A914EA03_9BILA